LTCAQPTGKLPWLRIRILKNVSCNSKGCSDCDGRPLRSAAVSLLASASANASLVAPCATATVPVDSCTIEYNSVIYQVSKTATASTFSNQFPAPSATSPGFWWGSDLAEKDAANLAGSALGNL
jgi:hypothetical protein